MKILLAEDDKNLGRLLQNLLKKENIKTDWVEDGDAAYEQCYRDGYDVLIVEDILDSGRTLKYVSEILKTRGANSISIVTLLDKPERRVAQISPDYVGCDVPDEFVVGYGLDYDQKYRNLPYIGALKRSVYEK